MIPKPAQALTDLAKKLAIGIAPETASAYAQANTGMISALMVALAEDSERAAANRLDDISDMQALFREAAKTYPDAPGSAARAAFCASAPRGFRISELDAFHAEGLLALIDLHTWSETHASKLEEQIWDFLRTHTERNRFEVTAL
ncbi:MAG: hypothetical protein ACO3Z6_01780 [Pseudomonadales bacterium]